MSSSSFKAYFFTYLRPSRLCVGIILPDCERGALSGTPPLSMKERAAAGAETNAATVDEEPSCCDDKPVASVEYRGGSVRDFLFGGVVGTFIELVSLIASIPPWVLFLKGPPVLPESS